MTREQCLNLIKGDARMEMVYTQSTDLCKTVYRRSGKDIVETKYGADGKIKTVCLLKSVL